MKPKSLSLSLNLEKKFDKIPKKLKNKNYFFIKKSIYFDDFYLISIISAYQINKNKKNKNFFKQVYFLNNKFILKLNSLTIAKKKLFFKINNIIIKEALMFKLHLLTRVEILSYFNFNFFFWKFNLKIINLNFNLYFFIYFLKNWLVLNTILNFKLLDKITFMNSINFHEEYFFFKWFVKQKKVSLVYNDVSTLLRVNSCPINFLDFFNEDINLNFNEFNLNSFNLVFDDYYFEILKKIKLSEHDCYFFKIKKFRFSKKNKKKISFNKIKFASLKKNLILRKSKLIKLRKIPSKIFFNIKWNLNMHFKFITKSLILSSNNEKIIYQNMYKTLASWNDQELNYNYNKQLKKNKDFYFKKGFVSKFNSFFIKKGKKLTSFNKVISSFSIFLNDSLDFLISEEYLKSSITIFFEFLNDSTSNININKILCWMTDISGFIYFFKTKALPKFLKKKLKKKYTTEPFFINSSLRYKYTLKYFYFFIENSDLSKLESRILSNVCSLAYENEESLFFDLRNKALKKAVIRSFKKKK